MYKNTFYGKSLLSGNKKIIILKINTIHIIIKTVFEKTLNKLLITKNDQYQSQIQKNNKNNISPDKMPKEQHIT